MNDFITFLPSEKQFPLSIATLKIYLVIHHSEFMIPYQIFSQMGKLYLLNDNGLSAWWMF